MLFVWMDRSYERQMRRGRSDSKPGHVKTLRCWDLRFGREAFVHVLASVRSVVVVRWVVSRRIVENIVVAVEEDWEELEVEGHLTKMMALVQRYTIVLLRVEREIGADRKQDCSLFQSSQLELQLEREIWEL